MSTESVEKVYRAVGGAGGQNVIHRDPDCPYLKNKDTVEKPADAFPDWFNRCSGCWG